MLTYLLDIGDLADARFVLSPLNETVLSLFHLQRAGASLPHLARWRGGEPDRRSSYNHAVIDALLSPSGKQTPDFLTPIPAADTRPTLHTHLAQLAGSDVQAVRRELSEVAEGTTPSLQLRRLIEHPDPAGHIAEALEGYYRAAIAPIWPTVQRILEADITFRGRELAEGGPARLFRSLTPQVSWQRTGELQVHLPCASSSGVFESGGRGLTMVPSVFIGRVVSAHDPRRALPHIGYPARGSATLTESAPPVADDALRRLIGAAKADLLFALAEPAAVNDLARALGISPSAVSQSLKVLSANGLVDGARHGRRVLYRRTEIGDSLITRSS